MKVLAVTPLLVVPRIEVVLPFWTGPMGYKTLVEVPAGDHLGFVLLGRGDEQLMLQTKESLVEDLPIVAERGITSFLYIDVKSVDEALGELGGTTVLVPPRETFYGTREVFVLDASGQVLGFAQKLK